jgi:lysophospholipase L1-like esterase
MGNSLMFIPQGVSLQDDYQTMLADHFGRSVQLRDHTGGGQFTADFLDMLRSDESLRAELAEADVVLFIIPNGEWEDVGATLLGQHGRDPAACGGADQLECLRTVADYESETDEILAELMTLVDPSRTVVRMSDFYVFTADQLGPAKLAAVSAVWKSCQDYVRQAAAADGIPVAQVFDAFMGQDGTQNPVAAGLVDPDGVHPTVAGAELMAKTVADLGYSTAD